MYTEPLGKLVWRKVFCIINLASIRGTLCDIPSQTGLDNVGALVTTTRRLMRFLRRTGNQ